MVLVVHNPSLLSFQTLVSVDLSIMTCWYKTGADFESVLLYLRKYFIVNRLGLSMFTYVTNNPRRRGAVRYRTVFTIKAWKLFERILNKSVAFLFLFHVVLAILNFNKPSSLFVEPNPTGISSFRCGIYCTNICSVWLGSWHRMNFFAM